MANANEAILLVIISKRAGSYVRQWGQRVIGLDGIYKLTRPGWPFWAIVVEDADGHGWPVALIVASIESKDILLCQFHVAKIWSSRITKAR